MQASTTEFKIEERILDAEDFIENIDSTVKVNAKCKKLIIQNIQEIHDTMRRPNLMVMGIEESKYLHLKSPLNIFNKIIGENFPNLKKDVLMNIQEAYRTPNRLAPAKIPPVTYYKHQMH